MCQNFLYALCIKLYRFIQAVSKLLSGLKLYLQPVYFVQRLFEGFYSKEIGDLYIKIGNKNKALKCYKHAVSLEPNSKEYYVSIAEVYDGMNEKDLAKEYYQKAIDINKKYFEDRPYRCDILKHIAELYLKIDDKENAKECYRKILEINPYDDEAADYFKNLND